MGKLNLGIPNRLIRPFAIRRRHQVAEKFVSLMAPIDGTALLDVGGPGLTTLLLAQHFEKVIVVNIDPASLSPDHISVPESFQGTLGDGCHIPLADESVDFVFSDNVIEHVKDDEYIQLLTARDLRALQPRPNVDGLGFSPLSETLIAWCRK